MCNLLHCGWQRHPCSTGADRWAHAKPRRKGCKGRWGCGAVGVFRVRGECFLGGVVFCIFLTRTQSAQADGTRTRTRFEREPPGGGGFAGCWTHAKPRRETQGAFESLQCGLDQPVVFEPLMGEHKCEPRTRVCGRAFCSTAAGGGIHCARPCTAVPGWPEGSQVTAVQSGVSPIRFPRSGFSIGWVVC